MVKAFVLIEVSTGHSRDVVNTLAENPKVVNASRVTGPYDVIAEVQEEDLNLVHEFTTQVIHHITGVVRTTTSVSVG